MCISKRIKWILKKSHREKKNFCIFFQSTHHVDMKNGVECYKDFFCYFNALKTNCVTWARYNLTYKRHVSPELQSVSEKHIWGKPMLSNLTKQALNKQQKDKRIKLLVISVVLRRSNLTLIYNTNPESTKQMEQTLRAKVKIFFKSENFKRCF